MTPTGDSPRRGVTPHGERRDTRPHDAFAPHAGRRYHRPVTDADWPFDQPADRAVFTLRSILFEGAPILHVSHDADDHGWQFLGLENADPVQAAIAALGNIVRRDPSVRQVADLPPSWRAWRRSTSSPWQRAPSQSSAE